MNILQFVTIKRTLQFGNQKIGKSSINSGLSLQRPMLFASPMILIDYWLQVKNFALSSINVKNISNSESPDYKYVEVLIKNEMF